MNENKSGLCTASMVLGIISLVTCLLLNLGFLPGLLGLIFAIVCLVKKKEPKGRAKAGLITSIIGLVIGFLAGLIGVIIIVSSGILVGAGIGKLGKLGKKLGNEINAQNLITDDFTNDFNFNFDDYNNLTSNTNTQPVPGDDDFVDYLSIFDGTEYEDWFTYNDDGSFTMNIPEDGGSTAGFSSDEHALYMGNTYFEDLTKYGYKYSYGDSTYSVYENENGAQFEFPAYVYNYKDYGSTKLAEYDKYITKLGVKDYPEEYGFYYDTELYDDISDEWEYAYADRVDDYGEYWNYEIWLFAFNDKYDDMVILIFRPSPEDGTFEKDFTDFMKTLKYMHPQ